MKTLIIIRHAKSDWSNYGLDDFERPLNKRGNTAAPFMAEKVKEQINKLDFIISSPAVRAFTTANYFATCFNFPEEQIQKELLIYESGTNQIIDLISKTDDKHQTIAIFGHNPEFTSMASLLSEQRFDNVPTCGVVCIDFDIKNWNEIYSNRGKLRFFLYPRMFFPKS